jgi:Fic family protein
MLITYASSLKINILEFNQLCFVFTSMRNGMKYQPPYTITSKIIHLIAQISESIGRLTALTQIQDSLKLRKANRIRTIQGSLAIEGNTLSTEQITAI